MNFMRDVIVALVFISFLLGCSDSEKDSNFTLIDVPVKTAKEIKLSTVAISVDSIALETLDNNLLNRISEIEHDEQSIFIADIDALFKFSRNGKFIKQIGNKGQGPGEYLNINDITLDRKRNHIYVASGISQKIICFDLEGKFVKESKIIGLNAIKVVNGSLHGIFTTYGMPSADKTKWIHNSYLVKFDQYFSPSDTILIKSVKMDKGTGTSVGRPGDQLLSEVNGSLYVYLNETYKEPFVRDTLFQIKDKKRLASLKLNFGIEDRLKENLFVQSILRTENHLVIDFSVERYSGMSIVHLPTNRTYIGKEFFQDDFWNTGSAKLMPWDLNNEEFYFIKEGMELVDKFDGVTGEENPYIFIVKLKTDSF
tara:strand:- start:1198 stop:2301 length:1104 start_codon:yes stop_codon:yes gene_type:complete